VPEVQVPVRLEHLHLSSALASAPEAVFGCLWSLGSAPPRRRRERKATLITFFSSRLRAAAPAAQASRPPCASVGDFAILLLLNARDLAALERASEARSAAADGADFIILATRVQLFVGEAERGERGQGDQGLRVSRVLTLELLAKRKGP
jgi:hypothetical protein